MKQRKEKALRFAGMMTVAATIVMGGAYSTVLQADEKTEIEQVKAGVGKLIAGGKADSIQPSMIDGLYEVMIGPQLFYFSSDGKYLISGQLFELETRKDLTTPRVSQAKAKAIEDVGEENMVIFSPEEYKHTVTVFTDIDCGYCRKLHNEIKDYNDLGIRVRYLMYPRAGVGSPSYDKAVSVWCSDDRKDALTLSKAGKDIAEKKCENPVKSHMELGQSLGINGTPAVFLEDGELMPGYVPAARMSAVLKQKDAK